MVQSVLHADGLAPTRSSDPVFGIAAGLYLALLLSPAVLLSASVMGVGGPAALYGTFLATGVVAVGLAGLVFSRRPGLVPTLGATRLRWLPAFLGVFGAVGSLAAFEIDGGLSVFGVFLGLFAALSGLLLGALARSRYVASVLASVSADAVFEAGWPDRARNRLLAVAGVGAALSAVAFVAGVVSGPDWLTTVGQFCFTLALVATMVVRSRTCRVTPAGLTVHDPVLKRLLPWSTFDGYSRTDDAVVLHRRWRVDLRFALDDLEDATRVEDAVARRLARA